MKPQRPTSPRPQRPQAAQAHPVRKASAGARKVLRWLAQGHELSDIARRLRRDEQGMKTRLDALLARLGADTPLAALELLKAQHAAAPAQAAPAADPVVDEFSDIPADDPPADAAAPADAAEASPAG